MKYFIIGASGLVGGNCYTFLKQEGHEVVGSHLDFKTEHTVYFNTIDLSSGQNFSIEDFNPDVIIHCGALTNVDYCENNPEESYLKTVTSVKNIVQIAKKLRAKLVYISTDYVFDGASGPYTEEANVHPINVYGKHKLEAEQWILQELNNCLIIRITNVYGNEIRNKNFVGRLVRSIRNNEEIKIVLPYDQFASPVNAWDVARAIDKLITSSCSGIYHVGSTDFYNRAQLFKKVLRYFPDYKLGNYQLVSTKELKQAAKRPLLGGLISAKFLNEFPDFSFSNIDSYLQNIIKSDSNEF